MLVRSLRHRPHGFAITRARGFTVIEVLTVVLIVGILAVAATPVFVSLMRDRRVNQAAMNVADVYRQARTRALGRGHPVLVRWDAAGGIKNGNTGLLTILEPNADIPFVTETCAGVPWNDGSKVREIGRVDFGRGLYDLADVQLFQAPLADALFTDPSANPGAAGVADMCFLPFGGAYLRTNTGDPFTQLTTIPAFRVKNKNTGVLRFVFLPPNGVARLKL